MIIHTHPHTTHWEHLMVNVKMGIGVEVTFIFLRPPVCYSPLPTFLLLLERNYLSYECIFFHICKLFKMLLCSSKQGKLQQRMVNLEAPIMKHTFPSARHAAAWRSRCSTSLCLNTMRVSSSLLAPSQLLPMSSSTSSCLPGSPSTSARSVGN